jgi:hypothetical protein
MKSHPHASRRALWCFHNPVSIICKDRSRADSGYKAGARNAHSARDFRRMWQDIEDTFVAVMDYLSAALYADPQAFITWVFIICIPLFAMAAYLSAKIVQEVSWAL